MSTSEHSSHVSNSPLYFSSLAQMEEAESILFQQYSSDPEQIKLPTFQEQVRRFIQRGVATGALLEDDERPRAQFLLTSWATRLTPHDPDNVPDYILVEYTEL